MPFVQTTSDILLYLIIEEFFLQIKVRLTKKILAVPYNRPFSEKFSGPSTL